MANSGKLPADIYQHLSYLGIRLMLAETECGVGEFRAHVDQVGQLVSSSAVIPRIEALTWNFIKSKIDWLIGAKWIVIETGLSEDMLLALLDFADQYGIPVCGLPTRLHCVGPRMHILGRLTCLLLNQREAGFILGNPIGTVAQTMDVVRLFSETGVRSVVVTMGEHGIVAANNGETPLFFRALPAKVQDPVGAGDAFAAAVVGSLAQGYPFTVAVFCGLRQAQRAVETRASVAVGLDTVGKTSRRGSSLARSA
jgi:sugar/nucleoside kinase (ribokinase family)